MLLDEIVKGIKVDKNMFSKGKSLYEEKKIKSFNFNLIPNSNICLFFAIIEDDYGSYNVSMDVRNRKVNYFKCGCQKFHNGEDFCEHLVCFSFCVVDKLNSLNSVVEDKTIDELIKKMNFVEKNYNIDHLIDLKMVCSVNPNDFELELKIGIKKYYTVKNIGNLLNDIECQRFFKYGKDFETNHELSKFNKKSTTLIDYLFSLRKMYDGFHSKQVLNNPKVLELVEYDIDNYVDAFKRYNLNFIILGNEQSLKYTNNLKFIFLSINKTSLEFKDFENFAFLQTHKRVYIFGKDYFSYINDDTDNEIIIHILKCLNESKGEIKFKENKGKILYEKTIPALKENFTLLFENEEEYIFKDYSAKTYIDLEEGIVVCRNEVYYDNLLDSFMSDNFLRDTYKENKLKNCFLEYGFNFKNDFYYCNLERIVHDFKNFLTRLKEISEIYVSDVLKDVDKKVVKKLNLTIRTKISSNLLEVNFDKSLSRGDIENILMAFKKKKRYYILNENEIIDLKSEDVNNLDNLFKDLDLEYNESSDSYVTNAAKFLLLNEYQNDFKLEYSKECLLFLNKLKDYKNLDYPINERFKSVLKNFQFEGYNFLKLLTEYSFGGILADEMGLGKTIQTLALIDNDEVNLPSLIVCPTSLVYNWESEIQKFANNLNCVVITGLQSTRKYLINNLKGKDIGIISYDTLRMDVEKFENVKLRFAILDEAQNIKNYKTQKSFAVKVLNSQVRFALTGTPIENYLSDLWSIFDFILPGYLKEYSEFRNEYENYIMESESKNRGKSLVKKVMPFILRRTKKEVLKELPDKYETKYYAKMEDEQLKLYKAYHLDIINKIEEKSNFVNILQGITKLRQVCADPNLIIEGYKGSSCKLDLCVELIKEYVSSNHKILVFSSFSTMLSNLMIALNKEGITALKLTGETKVKERLTLVDTFNSTNQYNVFLISLKAGGVGLNLTSSDCVIHYDPWWNIQAENQATDRSHRIGQTKNVEVIKLIVKGTIEEKIIELQETKKELSDLILEDKEITKESITSKDLFDLLN